MYPETILLDRVIFAPPRILDSKKSPHPLGLKKRDINFSLVRYKTLPHFFISILTNHVPHEIPKEF